MTRASLAIVVLLSTPLAQAQEVLLLAHDAPYANAWQRALETEYGIHVELADRPSGRTQVQRDADAQRIVATEGAERGIWLEHGELYAIGPDDDRALMSAIASRHGASLARASVLLMRGESAPRIAAIEDFDRDQHREPARSVIEPVARRSRREPDLVVYGGLMTSATFAARDDRLAVGPTLRAILGLRILSHVHLAMYADGGALANGEWGPLLRACGEVGIGYDWSTIGLHLGGHACSGYTQLPSQGAPHVSWSAGGALSFVVPLRPGTRLWIRTELDAAAGYIASELWLVPALIGGMTFE